jgi:hypothetical protein
MNPLGFSPGCGFLPGFCRYCRCFSTSVGTCTWCRGPGPCTRRPPGELRVAAYPPACRTRRVAGDHVGGARCGAVVSVSLALDPWRGSARHQPLVVFGSLCGAFDATAVKLMAAPAIRRNSVDLAGRGRDVHRRTALPVRAGMGRLDQYGRGVGIGAPNGFFYQRIVHRDGGTSRCCGLDCSA